MRCTVVSRPRRTAVASELAWAGASVLLLEATAPGAGTSGTSYAWCNANQELPRGLLPARPARVETHARLAGRDADWLHLTVTSVGRSLGLISKTCSGASGSCPTFATPFWSSAARCTLRLASEGRVSVGAGAARLPLHHRRVRQRAPSTLAGLVSPGKGDGAGRRAGFTTRGPGGRRRTPLSVRCPEGSPARPACRLRR